MKTGRYRFINYFLLALLVIVVAFPIYWLFRTAFVPSHLLIELPPVVVFTPSFEAITHIFARDNFLRHLVNSLVVALSATGIGITVGFSAAYGFSRFEYPGKGLLSVSVLFLYVMPPIAMLLPLYVIFQSAGLIGTRLALILTHSIITVPLSTWTLRGFIARMPIELEEAARIDGCNRATLIVLIVFPILAPGIVATMILSFIYSWNDFIYAVILTSGRMRTLPVLIGGYITDMAIYWGRIASAGLLVILPPFFFGFVVQPYLAEGLAAGAVKN